MLKVMSNFETKQGVLTYERFLQVILELGFDNGGARELDVKLTLCSLIQLLNEKESKKCPHLGYLDYKSIMRDLRSRPFAWWQERVQNNAFEFRNIFNKEGSFTQVLSSKRDPAYLRFQLSTLQMKL